MSVDLISKAEHLWDDGRTWPEILATLRSAGATKISCIQAAVRVLRIPLANAKMLVHSSDVWADARDLDDQFHDSFIAAAQAALDQPSTEKVSGEDSDAELPEREIAQHLVGVVAAIRTGDVKHAGVLLDGLLAKTTAERALFLSAGLTTALAEMSEIGDENLLNALWVLVTTTEQPGATRALKLAEEALAAS